MKYIPWNVLISHLNGVRTLGSELRTNAERMQK